MNLSFHMISIFIHSFPLFSTSSFIPMYSCLGTIKKSRERNVKLEQLTYGIEMGKKGVYKTASIFSGSQDVGPANLSNQDPHRNLGLGAMFHARRDPIKIVISVKELFGVEIRRQSYTNQLKSASIEGKE